MYLYNEFIINIRNDINLKNKITVSFETDISLLSIIRLFSPVKPFDILEYIVKIETFIFTKKFM